MQVDAAQPRDRQECGGEDLPVGRRHEQIGREFTHAIERLRCIDILRLQNRDSSSLGGLLDETGDELLFTPLRTVGLGHERDHIVPGVDQVLKRGQSKVSGAEHDYTDGQCLNPTWSLPAARGIPFPGVASGEVSSANDTKPDIGCVRPFSCNDLPLDALFKSGGRPRVVDGTRPRFAREKT
jgi:hypothetical protein